MKKIGSTYNEPGWSLEVVHSKCGAKLLIAKEDLFIGTEYEDIGFGASAPVDATMVECCACGCPMKIDVSHKKFQNPGLKRYEKWRESYGK